MNAAVQEAAYLRIPERLEWFEDMEIRFDGKVTHLSLQIGHKWDADGNPYVTRMLYDGKPIPLLPPIVDMVEQLLKSDDRFGPRED